MNIRGRRILVTGSEGFIGSHLTEALLKRGAAVRAFVLYNSFNSWGWLDTLPKAELRKLDVFTGDIRDPNGVLTAMKGVDAVFHLAALIGIPYSYHSPDSYVDTNIKGTLNVLQAARALNVKKIIHTSTSEVYGTAQYAPIDENHPLNPQSPYAATKSAADQLALSFYSSFDLPVVVARPFNTFGPRQSARAVIPTIISQIVSGARSIKLGNLGALRDLNYVTNTVDGFMDLLERDAGVGEVYNIGYGREVSVKEVFELVAGILKKRPRLVVAQERVRPAKSEVGRLLCDSAKFKKAFDWKPRVSLEKGLELTCRWIKNNLDRYKTDIYNV